ncbi:MULTISPECIES: ParB/RepB/Spo0J family partition protein [Colwellia]|uniref:Probable chromosome-partitioning protein ParB n=1 Tax=Colwellia psychrerythraea (strain 34H / ATCC BAA-681) TaxID=167879 RepID=Q47U41_COLP3|nr:MULTISPECIES: ParB/RepB/Spo0J family partition protein [Colwellia]AAZ26830.1 parB family protein [Colwellia psychrerythraea 34H]PKH86100.1 chromosome partitioning protein ParB [Colwellia sp. Bg11-28]
MSTAKRKGASRLGRGLDALLSPAIPAGESQTETTEASNSVKATDNELIKLPISKLVPGKYQPRREMSDAGLEELSLSIQSQGIIQPIVVRLVGDDQYEIIAGERRWRAAKLAQLDIIPCLVKNVPDESAVAIALIENIQREDLNAMEEAVALERLLVEFDLTHEEVAIAVGKSRTTVSNLLRLNKLNDEVKTLLENGDIEMGHARALLALEGEVQTSAAQTVATKELTVRETESLIKKIQNPVAEKEKVEKAIETIELEQGLAEKFGAKVSISHNQKGKGKLVISYTNLDKLDEILTKIR